MRLRPLEPLPRAILFDLDDTLCDYAGARQGRLRIAFSLDADGQPISRPDALLERMIADSIAMHPHGVEHFPALFAKYGIADEQSPRVAAAWYVTHRLHGLQLFPDAAEIVRSLRHTAPERDGRRTRPIGIVTNGPTEVQRAKVDLLGLRDLVDFVVISEEFGAAKPDPAIFAGALRRAGVAASDAVFIGDSPEFDIAGAHAAGIRSIWVNARGSAWRGEGRPPDREVRTLLDVPPLIGSELDPRGAADALDATRHSRRALMLGLAGAGAGLASAVAGAGVGRAQEQVATPLPAGNATPVASAAPRRGGTIALVRPGSSVANFNPSAFAQDLQIPLSYLEPLVRPDPQSLEPQPWLATGWSWDRDGLQLTFTLREGIRWHNGQPLTAADAAFAFTLYQQDIDSAVSGLFAAVASIEAASDRTLIVRFAARDGAWLFNAGSLPIFSRQQYERFWADQPEGQRSLSAFDWRSSFPVGTGPWQIGDWSETRVAFTRFDDYWGEPAWLDQLELFVKEGVQDRVEAWQFGQTQILWPAPPREVDDGRHSRSSAVAVPAASVMFAAFNFANPNQPAGSLWSDLLVRQAASLAIDRSRYADEVFGGRMQAMAAGTVAQPWAHDGAIRSPDFNPEAASILLGEAGWLDYNGDGILEDAAGTPLAPALIARDDMSAELIAVLGRVARDLAGVGIALSIEALPADEFDRRWIEQRDYDLIAYAFDLLPGFTDFDLYGSAWDIRTNPAGWNPGGYSNFTADAAIADYLSAVSIERQRQALARLQQAVNDDLFGLWLGFPDDVILIADNVQGFAPDMYWQTARTAQLWLRDAPA